MKKHLLIGSLLIASTVSLAQNFNWAKSMGGEMGEGGQAIAVDASGNVYSTGYFEGTADFDPGVAVFNLTSAGSWDVFISKLDVNGNFVWAKQLRGAAVSFAKDIKVDASGNVYTIGYFYGSVDFDPGATTAFNLTASGVNDIYVSKLNANGDFVWAKKMGGSGYDEGYSLALDAAGNVYTTGQFSVSGDFDPSPAIFYLVSNGDRDIFVSKLNSNGDFVWAKSIGSSNLDAGLSITLDTSGNVYSTGYFEATADFNPGAGTFNMNVVGGEDIFISKLDNNGNFVWAKKFGGIDNQRAHSITTDSVGNIYTTGYFESSTDFDPGASNYTLTSIGEKDIFINKLDSAGNFIWAKQIGSTLSDYANGITIDATGNVITTGIFSGTTDFDPGINSTNISPLAAADIFISSLDTAGNFVYAKSVGSSAASCAANAVTSDVAGNVYVTGWFGGTTDFDPNAGVFNIVPSGVFNMSEVFILKLSSSPLGIAGTTNELMAMLYPNPTSTSLSIKTDGEIQEISIYNSLGALVQTETESNFSVEQLPVGMYSIQLKTAKGTGTTRFIKN